MQLHKPQVHLYTSILVRYAELPTGSIVSCTGFLSKSILVGNHRVIRFTRRTLHANSHKEAKHDVRAKIRTTYR